MTNRPPRPKRQNGQAMIFGLLFLAVVMMALLMLYNQGQLVNNRVQLENAADATVYSQAKLAARNHNFIAYTNRAMIANEVSIGQMVALLSWAKHYKNVGAFVQYPAYRFPIAPPSPTTFTDVLSVITTPYRIMGTGVAAATKPVVDKWPTAVSYINGALGVFQNLFTISTLTAQLEMNQRVIKGHERDPDKPELYTPFIGLFFLAENAFLTFGGDKFSSASPMVTALDAVNTGPNDSADMVADHLGGQKADLQSSYNLNMPSTKAGDSSVASYQRFAALVNRNRDDFTQDRHWDIFPTVPDLIPPITLNFGIGSITIDLDFSVGAGVINDGGTAYTYKGNFDKNKDIEKLGWTSIDLMSFGVKFDVGLSVTIEICFISCFSESFSIGFQIPIGFPLAGATHQAVSSYSNANKTIADWPGLGTIDGIYGGDPDNSKNQGPFELFHAQTLGWGQVTPLLPGGIYGANKTVDVTESYAGPPAFLSLGRNFQESGVSYEFTYALAKRLEDINTSDNAASFNVRNDAKQSDWSDPDSTIGLERFELQSRSRAEAIDIEANYQKNVWNNDRSMMTISSAEVYFANPMQTNSDGTVEPASLFSPFWDARLKEPSAVALLMATGEIDWETLFGFMPKTASELIEYLLVKKANEIVDNSVENLTDKIVAPFDAIITPPIEAAGDKAKEAAASAASSIADEIGEFTD